MSEKQPEALPLAKVIDSREWSLEECDQAAALLRTQHADIERKDALLRQALDMFTINIEATTILDYLNARKSVVDAVRRELQ